MYFIFFRRHLHFLGVKPASFFALLTKEQIERSGFLFGELSHAWTLRGVNDLIRDARARLRYEADLSFSREAFEREVGTQRLATPSVFPLGSPSQDRYRCLCPWWSNFRASYEFQFDCTPLTFNKGKFTTYTRGNCNRFANWRTKYMKKI